MSFFNSVCLNQLIFSRLILFIKFHFLFSWLVILVKLWVSLESHGVFFQLLHRIQYVLLISDLHRVLSVLLVSHFDEAVFVVNLVSFFYICKTVFLAWWLIVCCSVVRRNGVLFPNFNCLSSLNGWKIRVSWFDGLTIRLLIVNWPRWSSKGLYIGLNSLRSRWNSWGFNISSLVTTFKVFDLQKLSLNVLIQHFNLIWQFLVLIFEWSQLFILYVNLLFHKFIILFSIHNKIMVEVNPFFQFINIG